MVAFAGGARTEDAHLIDDEGQLLSVKGIEEYLFTTLGASRGGDALHRVGVSYHVVGVLGGQSSGKSTLLNSLFGTKFQTMDETKRRGQTTKGAFISRANFEALCGDDGEMEAGAPAPMQSCVGKSLPLFVVDFEGTDGFERGEDQSFERQLSLFALSVADVLLINMWAVDVGRFNAANMSLLRTIFEVNLQLFSHDSYTKEEKPTLLVVLRDFTEVDTSTHFETVRKSFEKIWDNIVKPEAFKNSTIDTLFDLRYHVLPHFKLQRAAFDKETTKFRQWFYLSTCDEYLFHTRGMFRGVPLDGIPSYLSSCWEMIRKSKDLDIPTQREMLARHRCLEVKKQILQLFTEFCSNYTERLQRGELVTNLTYLLERDVDDKLRDFHQQTRLYRVDIVQRTEVELGEELLKVELKLVGDYAKFIASKVLEELETAVSGAIDGALRWLLHQAQSIPFLSVEAGGAGGGTEHMPHLNSVERAYSNDVYLTDNETCNVLVHSFWKRLCHALQAEVELLHRDYSKPHQRESQPLNLYDRYASLVAEDPALQEAVAHVVLDAVFQKVSRRFASMAENAAETIHQAFEGVLNRNQDGTVRFFHTTKALQRTEPQARQAGLVLLGCLLYYRVKVVADRVVQKPEDSDGLSRAAVHLLGERRKLVVRENSEEQKFFLHYTTISEAPRYPIGAPVVETDSADTSDNVVDRDCVFLSQQAVQRAFDLYTQKCEFTMQLQLRSIESEKQNLPAWVLPMLLLLGWNEIWYVLSSPVLLVVVVIIAVVFLRGFLLTQWAIFEETGPACVVVAVRVVVRQIRGIYNALFPMTPDDVRGNVARHRDPGSFSDVTASAVGTSWPSAAAEPTVLPPFTTSASLTRRLKKEE
ncbi:hypothetical protein MOQ_004806 [Trypanosoma cruzi marinkellei]|uniref:Protein SEY1 homolog n=1 Tax=Trypanosoma cruzi marinkellei TaxID=85056 RepID=K2NR05_TRYCR|nr:hypothetical protein MOQ_004806 [Trypanosoma cruzi marinkellei]